MGRESFLGKIYTPRGFKFERERGFTETDSSSLLLSSFPVIGGRPSHPFWIFSRDKIELNRIECEICYNISTVCKSC